MKILILNWKDPLAPDAGGAERYLLEVATRWVAGGHQVTLLGPRRREIHPLGVAGHPNGIRYLGVGSGMTVFQAANKYLRSSAGQFDRVLESVSTRPFAAHRIVGDRAVALYHQTAEDVWRLEFPVPISWLGEHFLEPRWIRRMRDARVVAVSPSTEAALKRHGVFSESIVPPGCRLPGVMERRLAPSFPPHVLWLGRLVRTKRPDDAIAAFKRIQAEIPGATLDLAGSGYLEGSIRVRHDPGVTVHGLVDEATKASLLGRADLLLLPGTREGWGIVAMEAAAYGVPVVAYDIPGLRDAVLDGVTGKVVRADPDALGSAAVSLLQDPNRWRQLSRAARRRVQEFTWDRAAQQLLTVLSGPTRGNAGLKLCGPPASRHASAPTVPSEHAACPVNLSGTL